MPEILAYATSQPTVTANVSDAADALGLPDGNVASVSNSSSTYYGVRSAFADLTAIPATATVTSVVFGVRCSSSTTNGDIQLNSRLADGTAVDSPVFDPATTLTDYEFTSARVWTPAELAGFLLSWNAHSTGTTSKTSQLDAVWVRVTYHEVVSDTKLYATAASGWTTNPANAVGAPDGVSASQFTAGGVLALTIPAFGLPADATVSRVLLGVRRMQTTTSSAFTAQFSVGDTAVYTMPNLSAASTLQDSEVALDPSLFTASMLNSPTTLSFTKGGTGTTSVDAGWVRVVTSPPTRAKCWDGSVWRDVPLRRWTGSAWLPMMIKRWDGTAWV